MIIFNFRLFKVYITAFHQRNKAEFFSNYSKHFQEKVCQGCGMNSLKMER